MRRLDRKVEARFGKAAGRARRLVVVLVVVLAFYVVLIGVRGISLLVDHRWVVRGLGVGILLLPLVGVAIVVAELRFGRATERLSLLVGEPAAATAVLDPDAAFELRKAQVKAAPQDWKAWYRLALAYGDARDTARGRRAMRQAIALERAMERPGSGPAALS